MRSRDSSAEATRARYLELRALALYLKREAALPIAALERARRAREERAALRPPSAELAVEVLRSLLAAPRERPRPSERV